MKTLLSQYERLSSLQVKNTCKGRRIGSGIISGILCLAMGWVANYVRPLLKKYMTGKSKLKK